MMLALQRVKCDLATRSRNKRVFSVGGSPIGFGDEAVAYHFIYNEVRLFKIVPAVHVYNWDRWESPLLIRSILHAAVQKKTKARTARRINRERADAHDVKLTHVLEVAVQCLNNAMDKLKNAEA